MNKNDYVDQIKRKSVVDKAQLTDSIPSVLLDRYSHGFTLHSHDYVDQIAGFAESYDDEKEQ